MHQPNAQRNPEAMTNTDHPTARQDPTSELNGNLAETANALFSAGSLDETFQRVVGPRR